MGKSVRLIDKDGKLITEKESVEMANRVLELEPFLEAQFDSTLTSPSFSHSDFQNILENSPEERALGTRGMELLSILKFFEGSCYTLEIIEW